MNSHGIKKRGSRNVSNACVKQSEIIMLKTLTINNGIIQPSLGKVKRVRNLLRSENLMPAGVLTEAGLPVRESEVIVFERDRLCPTRVNLLAVEVKHIDADAIYFSNPQNHFGHVLTGTMAFAHILLNDNYKNHKIVFIDEEPCEAVKILLGHLGIKEESIVTVKNYTQFKSVTVVEQSLRTLTLPRLYRRSFAINNEFVDTFRSIAAKFIDNNSPRKVYFSRSKLKYNATLGEDKIERVFENNGYAIFYPEQLPLDEQIRLVANCDSYVCVQGSLEHHSLFMKDSSEMIVMIRRDTPTERQLLINKIQPAIKKTYLRANVRPFGDRRPSIIGATDDLIRFFDERSFEYNIENLKPTRDDLKEYIVKCFEENGERMIKYICRKLIRRHRSFWNQTLSF